MLYFCLIAVELILLSLSNEVYNFIVQFLWSHNLSLSTYLLVDVLDNSLVITCDFISCTLFSRRVPVIHCFLENSLTVIMRSLVSTLADLECPGDCISIMTVLLVSTIFS